MVCYGLLPPLCVCTLQHFLCCTFSPSWFLEIKALDFAVWWTICVAFVRASCDFLWITMHAYGHSESACTADFQFIFTMFLSFNCPKRNVMRARLKEALWRRQLWRRQTPVQPCIFSLIWKHFSAAVNQSKEVCCHLSTSCSLLLKSVIFSWNTLMWKAPVMCALLIWHEYPMRATIRGNCLWCKCCFNSFDAVNYSSTFSGSPLRRLKMAWLQWLPPFESFLHQSS